MASVEIHVMVGIVSDPAGRVLIARRPTGKSFAGQWEFPGGKLDMGEERFEGLVRELEEELGIEVETARPLIRYRHSYSDLEVDLDAWYVTRWRGEPRGREGQVLAWHEPTPLLRQGLLRADNAIVDAIRLPSVLLVTPLSAGDRRTEFLDRLEIVTRVTTLVCLRRPDLDASSLLDLALGAACRIEGTGTKLLLHGDPEKLAPVLLDMPAALRPRLGDAVAGLHVPARFLGGISARPVPSGRWFGASCHNAVELEAAHVAGADYAFLGPVNATPSHPGASGLGWDKFSELVKDLPLPVYAIGGVGPDDLETAWAAGAQGVAGISAFWPK